jgi:hypothetical protein
MDPRTKRNLVKVDLRMESHVVIQQPLLTPNTQEMNKERCHKLLNMLKASQPRLVWIFFCDEKIITGDAVINCCSSCYLTDLPVTNVDPSIRLSPFAKVSLKQIALGRWAANSQKDLIIFDDALVSAAVYQDLLWQHVVPGSRERILMAITSSGRIRCMPTPPGPPRSS